MSDYDHGRRRGRPLPALQLLRGCAALLVVAFHTNLGFGPALLVKGSDLGGVFLFGHAGVDLFFVLSGFIIAFAHWDDAPTSANLRRYVASRVIRIYPMTVLTVASLAAIVPLLRWVAADPSLFTYDATQLAASMLLMPLTCDYLPGVLWSLQNEVYFYAVFCCYFLSRRLLAVAAAAWIAAIIANAVLRVAPGPLSCASGILGLYNLLFIGGIGAYVAWRQLRNRASRPAITGIVFLGLAILPPVAVLDVMTLTPVYLGQIPADGFAGAKLVLRAGYGVGFSLLVLGASLADWSPRGRLQRLLVASGDASFSIYLVHLPVVGTLSRVFAAAGEGTTGGAMAVFILIVMASWMLGLVVHLRVERPLLAALRRRSSMRTPAITADAAA